MNNAEFTVFYVELATHMCVKKRRLSITLQQIFTIYFKPLKFLSIVFVLQIPSQNQTISDVRKTLKQDVENSLTFLNNSKSMI